jgi:hypothetical protein
MLMRAPVVVRDAPEALLPLTPAPFDQVSGPSSISTSIG